MTSQSWDPILAGQDARQMGEAGSNAVREVDQALHPQGDNIVQLIMKSRVEPHLQGYADHIFSMQIRLGLFDGILGVDGKEMDAGGAILLASTINSYGKKGMAREELIDGIGAIPVLRRNNGQGGNGGDLGQ